MSSNSLNAGGGASLGGIHVNTAESHLFVDYAVALVEQASVLLEALTSMRLALDPESIQNSGLLTRSLAQVVPALSPPDAAARPPFEPVRLLSDSNYSSLVKSFIKKFPDLNEAVKIGASISHFNSASSELLAELKPYYEAFVAVQDFCEISLNTLLQANSIVKLGSDLTPSITEVFLDLLCAYYNILQLSANVGQERKAVLSAYAKAYSNIYSINEPSWNRLSKFIVNNERPSQVIQDNLTPIAPKIIALLASFKSDLDLRILPNADRLRNLVTLSLTPQMSGIKAPEPDEKHLRSFLRMGKHFSAFIICSICCANEMIKQNYATDLLKQAISYSYVIPIIRGESWGILNEFDIMVKNSSKLSKLRSVVSDGVSTAFQTAPQFHKDRRDYLRSQLRQMISLCIVDEVIYSKFWMVTAALAFAKEEILWYFHHYELDLSGKRLKVKKGDNKLSSGVVFDFGITELMWLTNELRIRILAIKDYVISNLAQQMILAIKKSKPLISDALNIPEVASDNMGAILLGILDNIEEHMSIKFWEKRLEPNLLEAFRLNCLRFQLASSLSLLPNLPDLHSAITDMFGISRWLDNYDLEMENICSLKELYYFQNLLQENFKETVESDLADTFRCIGIYATLGTEFSKNARGAWEDEFRQISLNSVLYTNEICSAIGQLGASMAHDLAVMMMRSHSQIHPKEAYLNSIGKDTIRKKAGKNKLTIERVMVKPGLESNMRMFQPSLKGLEKAKHMLKNIIAACCTPKMIPVADSELSPVHFLIDSLIEKFKSFLVLNSSRTVDFRSLSSPLSPLMSAGSSPLSSPVQQSVNDADGLTYDVKRPSVFLAEIKGYLHSMKWIQGLLDEDLLKSLKEVLIEQVNPENARYISETQTDMWTFHNLNKPVLKKEKTRPPPPAQPILYTYAHWYCELATLKASSGHLCISMDGKTLLCRGTWSSSVDLYIDRNELCALAELVGPLGMRFIDEKLLKSVVAQANIVKDAIGQNLDFFSSLRQTWPEDLRALDILRRLKGMKEINQRSIAFGFLLEFRRVLHSCCSEVFQSHAPVLHASVKAMQQKSSVIESEGSTERRNFETTDIIANNIGLTDIIDLNLQEALRSVIIASDSPVWFQLPSFFAASLWYLTFDDTSAYSSSFDGLENNGHCLSTAFQTLCVVYNTLFNKDNPNMIAIAHAEFLNISSTLILRLRQKNLEKDLQAKNTVSAIFVMKRFIEQNKYLARSTSQQYIPSTLIQQTTGEYYRKRSSLHENIPGLQFASKRGIGSNQSLNEEVE